MSEGVPVWFSLYRHSKQGGDESHLPKDIPFVHSLHLSFPDQVHDLIAPAWDSLEKNSYFFYAFQFLIVELKKCDYSAITMGLNGAIGDVVSVKRWYHVGEKEAPHYGRVVLDDQGRRNAARPLDGTMGECDDHATDQRGPSLQAELCLTAGMQVGESTENVQGGKRVCMHCYLPLVAASFTPSIREATYIVLSRRSGR
jgi:hypothetical protein